MYTFKRTLFFCVNKFFKLDYLIEQAYKTQHNLYNVYLKILYKYTGTINISTTILPQHHSSLLFVPFKRHSIKYIPKYRLKGKLIVTRNIKNKINKKTKAPSLVIISKNNSAWVVTSSAVHANNHK